MASNSPPSTPPPVSDPSDILVADENVINDFLKSVAELGPEAMFWQNFSENTKDYAKRQHAVIDSYVDFLRKGKLLQGK